MLLALGAASSVLDALKALTSPKALTFWATTSVPLDCMSPLKRWRTSLHVCASFMSTSRGRVSPPGLVPTCGGGWRPVRCSRRSAGASFERWTPPPPWERPITSSRRRCSCRSRPAGVSGPASSICRTCFAACVRSERALCRGRRYPSLLCHARLAVVGHRRGRRPAMG